MDLFCLISPILPEAHREGGNQRENERKKYFFFLVSVLLPCQGKSDHSAEIHTCAHTYTHIHTKKTNCFSLTDWPWGQLTAHRWKGEVWPGTLRPGVEHLRMPGEGQVQLQATTLALQPIGHTHTHTNKFWSKYIKVWQLYFNQARGSFYKHAHIFLSSNVQEIMSF